jgi:hypothetical protein
LALLAAVAAGCGGAVPAAPPPYRPEARAELLPPPAAPAQTDCTTTDPSTALPSVKYNERSRDEADDLAAAGLKQLKAAAVDGIDPATREEAITSAVDLFVNSLRADPYNVDATYNLASTYALIGRSQCSLNLLERLVQMRTHPSKAAQVEAKLDRLLGRKRAVLDPDFNAMRGDPRFRTLISGMCANSSDAGCMQ